MHPEMSLVFLTVLAGAGQGIFIILVLLDALFFGSGRLSSAFFLAAGGLSLALPTIGMAGSFFHLGNPFRGWKAVRMWKQSWLSREVIFLPAFLAMDAAYLADSLFGASPGVRLFTGLLGVVMAVGLYLSSAMLYAAIRYVKEWSNGFTPVNFILFGLTSGAAIVVALYQYTGNDLVINSGLLNLLVFLASFSLVLKAMAYRHNTVVYPSVGIKNALGMNNPNIRLMDPGAAYDHYNTTEYYFPITPAEDSFQQGIVLAGAFFTPMLIALFASYVPSFPGSRELLAAGALLSVGCLFVERRLFFIQGNHLQNIYYGNFRKSMVANPLASRARKGAPVPKK